MVENEEKSQQSVGPFERLMKRAEEALMGKWYRKATALAVIAIAKELHELNLHLTDIKIAIRSLN
jgi:hypothetical protein